MSVSASLPLCCAPQPCPQRACSRADMLGCRPGNEASATMLSLGINRYHAMLCTSCDTATTDCRRSMPLQVWRTRLAWCVCTRAGGHALQCDRRWTAMRASHPDCHWPLAVESCWSRSCWRASDRCADTCKASTSRCSASCASAAACAKPDRQALLFKDKLWRSVSSVRSCPEHPGSHASA